MLLDNLHPAGSNYVIEQHSTRLHVTFPHPALTLQSFPQAATLLPCIICAQQLLDNAQAYLVSRFVPDAKVNILLNQTLSRVPSSVGGALKMEQFYSSE